MLVITLVIDLPHQMGTSTVASLLSSLSFLLLLVLNGPLIDGLVRVDLTVVGLCLYNNLDDPSCRSSDRLRFFRVDLAPLLRGNQIGLRCTSSL